MHKFKLQQFHWKSFVMWLINIIHIWIRMGLLSVWLICRTVVCYYDIFSLYKNVYNFVKSVKGRTLNSKFSMDILFNKWIQGLCSLGIYGRCEPERALHIILASCKAFQMWYWFGEFIEFYGNHKDGFLLLYFVIYFLKDDKELTSSGNYMTVKEGNIALVHNINDTWVLCGRFYMSLFLNLLGHKRKKFYVYFIVHILSDEKVQISLKWSWEFAIYSQSNVAVESSMSSKKLVILTNR